MVIIGYHWISLDIMLLDFIQLHIVGYITQHITQ